MFKGKGKNKLLVGLAASILLLGLTDVSMASVPKENAQSGLSQQSARLVDKVRHELVMLPYYGVFDNLSFAVEGSNTVVLTGQVTRPVLKSDAEGVVRRIEGVEKVVNKIEVLPLSPFDDSIRRAAYRAIFFRPGFEKYAVQAVSPIRIIVKNGNITLEGVVGSEFDKTVADIAAKSVPGAFTVTDNLTVG